MASPTAMPCSKLKKHWSRVLNYNFCWTSSLTFDIKNYRYQTQFIETHNTIFVTAIPSTPASECPPRTCQVRFNVSSDPGSSNSSSSNQSAGSAKDETLSDLKEGHDTDDVDSGIDTSELDFIIRLKSGEHFGYLLQSLVLASSCADYPPVSVSTLLITCYHIFFFN